MWGSLDAYAVVGWSHGFLAFVTETSLELKGWQRLQSLFVTFARGYVVVLACEEGAGLLKG